MYSQGTNDVHLVHIWDFYSKKVVRSVAITGDVPARVHSALNGYHKGSPTKQQEAITRQYFGPQYKTKLGLDIITGGAQETPRTEEVIDFTESDLAAFSLEKPRAQSKKAPFVPPALTLSKWSAADITIWPFDKYSEVREKIYMATGIPPYRQHIFCDDTDYVMYRVLLHGLYNVDIRDTADLQHVAGVPVDRYMVENKDAVRVETFDVFRTAESLTWPLFVVDLGEIIERNKTQFQDSMRDSFTRELLYYGFILKYWPMFCAQCFVDYFNNEADLLLNYPGFYRPLAVLIPAIKKETALLKKIVSNDKHLLPIAVTRLVATIKCPLYSVSLRALFDRFVLTERYPALCLYSDHQGGKYLIKKTYIGSTVHFPSFPTGKRMVPMVVIAVSILPSNFVFVSVYENGTCNLRVEWTEEQQMQMSQLIVFLCSTVNPVIDLLNQNGAHIAQITPVNIVFKGMTVCAYWKHTVSAKNFKVAVDCWTDYISAGILVPHGVSTTDRTEFIFKKFMVNFDPVAIERILKASNDISIANFYSYLSTGIVQTKWSQHYEGRKMTMMHRITDIKFEIIDIHESEFDLYYKTLSAFCKFAETVVEKQPRLVSTGTQKLRALKETDPALFSFVAIERSVKSVNTYSVACQKPMQPVIHDSEVPRSTKYWNFSTDRPAYYVCPNPKYPRLGFIKDIHPEHLCVPCCYKVSSAHESYKKAHTTSWCLKHRRQPTAQDSVLLTHVLDYGKAVDPGRYTRIPPVLQKLLRSQNDARYTLLGVQQHLSFLRNVGILFAIAAALKTDVETLLTTYATETPNVFHILLQGTMTDYYERPELFAADLLALAKDKPVQGVWFNKWTDVFCDLAYYVSRCVVLRLIDSRGDGQVLLSFSPSLPLRVAENKMCVVLQQGTKHIFLLTKEDGASEQITLFWKDACSAAFIKMIQANSFDVTQWRTVDFELLTRLVKDRGQIDTVFVNLASWCYAVLLTLDNRKIYCPVRYAPFGGQKSEQLLVSHSAYLGEPRIPMVDAKWFIAELQAFISNGEELLYADMVNADDHMTPFGPMCNNGGIIYCDTTVTEPAWDPKKLTSAILKREPPTVDKTQEAPRALYESHQYGLFLQETVKFLSRNVNVGIRAQIVKALKVKKIDTAFRSNLKAILKDHLGDLKDIWLLVDDVVRRKGSTDLTNEDFSAALQRVRFGFDRVLVTRINEMSIADATRTLLDLTREYIIHNPAAIITDFPNIRSCCATMHPKPNYCADDKLIITGDLASFCELAVVDLRNPIKSKFLFDVSDVVVMSYFDFVRRPEESIEIIRLANV